MFRGDAGKWSRWGLGFLWGLEGGGQQLEDVLGHMLEPRLAPLCRGMCRRVCLGPGQRAG